MEPRCIASTTASAGAKGEEEHRRSSPSTKSSATLRNNVGAYQRAEFSADGSTVVAYTEDQRLQTFLLPANLLEPESQPHHLTAHSIIQSPTRTQSYCIFPGYDQFDSSTMLLLQASSDVPIALRYAFSADHHVAKYNLIHPTTEAYLKSSSMQFISHGSHFVVGSKDLLAIFDTSQDGSDPIMKHGKNINASKRSLQARLATTGIVSCLATNHERILATGTFNRTIGLYSNEGLGECTSAWSLGQSDGDPNNSGSGLVKLLWSPNNTVLFAAERQSDIVHVFDVRNTGRRVGWLTGRKANTTQKLEMELVPTLYGIEIWAGGTDGCVRIWSNPGSKDGEHLPDDRIVCHEDAVSSAVWDRSGTILATCSGSRYGLFSDTHKLLGDSAERDSSPDQLSQTKRDNSLKIWTIENSPDTAAG